MTLPDPAVAADTAAAPSTTGRLQNGWKTTYSPAETETVPCPLCGTTAQEPIAREWSLGVVRCPSCRLVYVSPRVRDPEKNYWGSEAIAARKYAAVFEGRAPHDRDRNYVEHLDAIARLKPSGRLLDIGTHCGFFLRMARGRGWDLHGIEPSPTNAELARRAFGLTITNDYLREATFPPESFDVVTLVDVFEHITNPVELLGHVRRVLKPDGVLFIKVPHARWNLLKHRVLIRMLHLDGFDIFDSREHVVHYTQETLGRMLAAAGFRPRRFYVPRPIQSGRDWKKAGRWLAWHAARAQFAVSGTLGPLSTDVACLAEREVP